MSEPFSVHITFGSYGTRLHGDERPTVHHRRNQVGQPFEDTNRSTARHARQSMNHECVLLTQSQRVLIEQSMVDVCRRGGWTLHEVACQEDHIHLLVTIETEAKKVRKWIKTWLPQLLNEKEGTRQWWAKGGSCKHVFDEKYFEAVCRYIKEQKTV